MRRWALLEIAMPSNSCSMSFDCVVIRADDAEAVSHEKKRILRLARENIGSEDVDYTLSSISLVDLPPVIRQLCKSRVKATVSVVWRKVDPSEATIRKSA